MRHIRSELSFVTVILALFLGCDDFSHDGIINTPPPNYLNVLVSTTVGGDLDDSGNDIVATAGGKYLIVGATSSWGNGDSSLFVAQVNGIGGVVWESFSGGWGIDYGEALVAVDDSSFLLVGSTSSIDMTTQIVVDPNINPVFDFLDRNIYLVRIDTGGVIWWERALGQSTSNERVTGMVRDGSEFLISTVRSSEASDELLLVRVDVDGVSVGETAYPVSAAGVQAEVIATGSGTFILGGCGHYGVDRCWDPFFIKVDNSGGVIWEKRYGWTGSNERVLGLAADDNGVVACGYSEQYIGTDSAATLLYLIKLDGDGNLVWENTYDQSGLNEGRALVRKPDSSWIVAGTNHSVLQIDVCKVSPDGLLEWSDNTRVSGQVAAMIPSSRGYIVTGSIPQPGASHLSDALFLEFAEDFTDID